MSKMQELYEKVSKDSVLQEKFATIIKEAEAAGKKATEEKLTAFAKEAGYDVTVEEMQDFFKDHAEKNRAELRPEELDMVAGGKHGGFIRASIATLGVLCVTVSAAALIDGKDCEEYYIYWYT